MCAGSIISKRAVLTAAHCVRGANDQSIISACACVVSFLYVVCSSVLTLFYLFIWEVVLKK